MPTLQSDLKAALAICQATSTPWKELLSRLDAKLEVDAKLEMDVKEKEEERQKIMALRLVRSAPTCQHLLGWRASLCWMVSLHLELEAPGLSRVQRSELHTLLTDAGQGFLDVRIKMRLWQEARASEAHRKGVRGGPGGVPGL